MRRLFIILTILKFIASSPQIFAQTEPQNISCYSSRQEYCADGSSITTWESFSCMSTGGCGECGGSDFPGYSQSCPQPQFRTCFNKVSKLCDDGQTTVDDYSTFNCSVYRSCSECGGLDDPGQTAQCPQKSLKTCLSRQTYECKDKSWAVEYSTLSCFVYSSCTEASCNALDWAGNDSRACPKD